MVELGDDPLNRACNVISRTDHQRPSSGGRGSPLVIELGSLGGGQRSPMVPGPCEFFEPIWGHLHEDENVARGGQRGQPVRVIGNACGGCDHRAFANRQRAHEEIGLQRMQGGNAGGVGNVLARSALARLDVAVAVQERPLQALGQRYAQG